ncbi:unnamed protein product [Ectocarpus sp. CCAP 1310/34]|nr:unnamed protein product [Ectocarpus sp. CCAP 1310/34]
MEVAANQELRKGAAKVKGANNADAGAAANPLTAAPTVAAAASTASSAAGVPAEGGGAGAAGAATPSAPTVPDLMKQCNDYFEAYNESPKFAKLLEACADWLPVQSYPLQRCVPARRWLDVTMLESLLFNRRAMELALMKNEPLVPDAAKKLGWGFVEAVVAVLNPFAEATRTMETDKHSTIGLVLELLALLRKKIDGLLKHENGAIRVAAWNMSIELGRRWVGASSLWTVSTIDPSAETLGTSGCKKIHFAAAVLDPRAKGMARIPGYVMDYAFGIVADLAEQLMEEKLAKEFDIASYLNEDEEEMGESVGARETGAAHAGGGKSGGITGGKGAGQANRKSVMARLFDSDSDQEEDAEVETRSFKGDSLPLPPTERSKRKDQYLAQIRWEVLRYRALDKIDSESDPLLWWEQGQQRWSFPSLRQLAMRVLCVPACSASSKRLFFKTGVVGNSKRARLRGSRVAQRLTVCGAVACGLLDKCY